MAFTQILHECVSTKVYINEYRHKVVQDLNFLRACNAIVSTPRCFLLPFVNILCGLAARCVSSLRSRPTRSSAVFEWRSTKPCRSYRTCSAQHCSWPSSGLLGNRPHTPMSFLPPKKRSNRGRDKCQIKIIVVIRAAGFAYEPLSSLPCWAAGRSTSSAHSPRDWAILSRPGVAARQAVQTYHALTWYEIAKCQY